jgi:hypothetical protein
MDFQALSGSFDRIYRIIGIKTEVEQLKSQKGE